MNEKLPFSPETVQTVVEAGKSIVGNSELDNKAKREKLHVTLKQLAPSPKFTILQDAMIDVIVAFRTEIVMEKRKSMPSIAEMAEALRNLIGERFQDNADLKDLLLEAVPSITAITNWLKRPDFKEEVERRMKDDSLFSPEKRAFMIQNLYKLSMDDGNMKAAEMWLKISGELKPHVENKDKTLREFEEFNQALWTKQNKGD